MKEMRRIYLKNDYFWFTEANVDTVDFLLISAEHGTITQEFKLLTHPITQIDLLNEVNKFLKAQALKIVPFKIGRRKFAMIMSKRERSYKSRGLVKRNVAIVAIRNGQLNGLKQIGKLRDVFKIKQVDLNGFKVNRTIIDLKQVDF